VIFQKEQNDMSKFVNASSAAMSDADKTAMKKASDTCKAQVKEEARFNEMSWWARHKAVKKCVSDMLAGH
jgi:stress-induced morphogen